MTRKFASRLKLSVATSTQKGKVDELIAAILRGEESGPPQDFEMAVFIAERRKNNALKEGPD